MKMPRLLPLAVAGLAALVFAASASPSSGQQPTFVTTTVDDTTFFGFTSAVCGFPVYEHDVGTVTTKVTTMPDGSVKSHDIVVKIDETFYSTDPAHTGTVTTRPSGPFIEIDNPDGSVTMNSIGQEGHVTIPGQGIVWASSGIVKVEIDPSGNVTEVDHGNMSPDHTGICPLL
jgi:hypothetical protein